MRTTTASMSHIAIKVKTTWISSKAHGLSHTGFGFFLQFALQGSSVHAQNSGGL